MVEAIEISFFFKSIPSSLEAPFLKANNLNITKAAVLGSLKGIDIIEQAIKNGALKIDEREKMWMDKIRQEISAIPLNESDFIEMTLPNLDKSKWYPGEYGL